MACDPTRFEEIRRQVTRIAVEIAGPHARDVDRYARFPDATIDALREDGLLGASIPAEFGGVGCSAVEVAWICQVLARGCGSSGAIFAMHQIQLYCIARHAAAEPYFADFLRKAASAQLLVASATSEVGTGGDVGKSIAPIVRDNDKFSFRKECPAVSYAEDADYILASARKSPEAATSDQVLVLLKRDDYRLEDIGTWDSMGMRGTCSLPLTLTASGHLEQIMSEDFRMVASRTMVPYAHILWAACWSGIAGSAVAKARLFTNARAGGVAGPVLTGDVLVSAVNDLLVLDAYVRMAADDYDHSINGAAGTVKLGSATAALRVNGLKMTASELAAKVCLSALNVCGISGYLESSEYSVARHVRDALSAPLMISNQRLAEANAHLLKLPGDILGWRA